MGWQDDLLDLLGDAAGDALGTGTGQAAVSALTSNPADYIFKTIDAPFANLVRAPIGSLVNLAQGEGMAGVGIEAGQREWDESFAAFRANEDFGPGGSLGILKGPIELALNVAADPLTWTGIGAAGKGAKALKVAADAASLRGSTGMATGLRGAAMGLQGAQRLNDLPGEQLLPRLQGGITRVATSQPVARTGLLAESAKSQAANRASALHDIANTLSAHADPFATGVDFSLPPNAYGSLAEAGIPDIPALRTSPLTGQNPRLTLEQNALLDTKLPDGRTYRDVWTQTRDEASLDMQALRKSGITWKGDATPAERLKLVEGNPELEKIVKRWNTEGLDIAHAGNPDRVAAERVRHLANDAAGITYEPPTGLDLMRSAFGEQVLFTPRYHFGNLLGGWTQNLIAGITNFPPLRDIVTAFKAYRAGSDVITREAARESLHGVQHMRLYGMEVPDAAFRGGVHALTSGVTEESGTAIGKIAGRVTHNEALGRTVGKPFEANAAMAQAVETVIRVPLVDQVATDEVRRLLPAWESEVRSRGAHIPGFQFDLAQGINAPPNLDYDVVKAHLQDLGLQSGQAEHLSRQLTEIKGVALKKARAEMDRIQFYGSRTNLDEKVRKIVPFHYWYSRALRYYGEESVRHPYLLLNYLRVNDGIEDAQNDPGLSARQKGFLRLLPTPLGFSLLMNPDALFGTVKVLGMDQYEREQGGDQWHDPPSGMTPLGGALDWLKQRGFGMYPWLDGTLNLMGTYGNTFEPDLLNIRHQALVGAAINFVRAQTGFDPLGAPYQNAMGQARGATSGFAASILPDWLAQPVTPKAGKSSQEATLDTLIESIVMTDNPTLTNGELLAIMSDPDSPEYDAAYQKASTAGLVNQFLSLTVPVSMKLRHDATDVRRAQIDVVLEEAKEQGVAPWEIAPTPQDIDFLARYKARTGQDYSAEGYLDAKTKNDLAKAPDESKVFIYQEAEYNAMGTPEERAAYDAYSAIKDGTDPSTAGLSEDERWSKATTWLGRNRGANRKIDSLRAKQSAFVETHPEFAQFKAWQGQMYAVKTAFGGTLAEYRRQASAENPNAARYFTDQWDWITRNTPEAEWDEKLDQATANASAFLAIMGTPEARSVQGPIPGVPKADVTLPVIAQQAQYGPTPTPGGAGSPNTDWRSELAQIGAHAGLQVRPGF